jgi:hypothetical protein
MRLDSLLGQEGSESSSVLDGQEPRACQRIASLFAIDEEVDSPWRSDEYASLWRHQLRSHWQAS